MTTLGERIKAYRSQLGINQKELAERASSIDKREKASKWGQSRIANYEVGARTPDLEDIAILAKVLNVLPETLAFDVNVEKISVKNSYSYPIVSSIEAGPWTEMCDYRDSMGYEYLDSEIEADENAFFLRVSGMSMEPKFSDGDLVLIDPTIRATPGSFVAAVNGSGEATLKRYRELGDIAPSGNPHFELVPLNPDFPTLSSKKQDIRILGVAVEHRSYL